MLLEFSVILNAYNLVFISPGQKTIKKNSTQNKFQTQHARAYKVTPFLSTDCELSTETYSENVYSAEPWYVHVVICTGTKACVKLEEVILNKRLATAIRKLSPLHQTSDLESFHSILNHFAPKMLSFSFKGMKTR